VKISRRSFLKMTAASFTTAYLAGLGFDLSEEALAVEKLRIARAEEASTICSFCSCGCGLIVSSEHGRPVNIEGNPDHPINQGNLCAKGASMFQIAADTAKLRNKKVRYRGAGKNEWEEKSWAWAITEIARKVKETRDASFTVTEGGVTVNRTEAIGALGGSTANNEESYLWAKLMRVLGLVYIDSQVGLNCSPAAAALSATLGRSAMTNHLVDIRNSDCILMIGANAAENYPMAFKWALKAVEERNAQLICVDPRFTRSAAKADIYASLRSGTDATFIMGIINYIIQNGLYHEEYVKEFTNAGFLIDPAFGFNDGIFSGYDSAERVYNDDSWSYQTASQTFTESTKSTKKKTKTVRLTGKIPQRDLALNSPNSVFQLLKNHAARYTPELVEKITGCPKDKFVEICEVYVKTGEPQKTGTIICSSGLTQHTIGSQNIRAAVILQLLLGNIGRPGGGVNTLGGESNSQGSMDCGLVWDSLPGYLAVPDAEKHPGYKAYIEQYSVDKKVNNVLPGSVSRWQDGEKYLVSLLKAFWGDAAQSGNNFCYDWLPKCGSGYEGGKYYQQTLFEAMSKGEINGLFVLDQNPVVGGPNSNLKAEALEQLDWVVDIGLWETETTAFWKRPGADPSKIQTEVFSLPTADVAEKEGSVTNCGRWMQWRYKGVEPPGECKSVLGILDLFVKELKIIYGDEGGPNAEAVVQMVWDYGDEPDSEEVARECHGYFWPDKGRLVENYSQLQKDGSTACGNWILSGSFSPEGKNFMKRRIPEKEGVGSNLEWAFSWPINIRILYNRASSNIDGVPWDGTRPLVWWDPNAGVTTKSGKSGAWIGHDIPDFSEILSPNAQGGGLPALMKTEGVFGIFVPMADGPFPEYYEPLESPLEKNLISGQKNNPVTFLWHDINSANKIGEAKDYSIVGFTFQVAEHWQAGNATRNIPWLAELISEMYVEISKELAEEKNVKNGDTVRIESARGDVEAIAIVTERLKSLKVGEKTIHQIGIPWCFGYTGLITGGTDKGKNYAGNQLTPCIGDGNTMTPEYKAFLCNVKKVT